MKTKKDFQEKIYRFSVFCFVLTFALGLFLSLKQISFAEEKSKINENDEENYKEILANQKNTAEIEALYSSTNLGRLAKKVDFTTFLGKTVKIPIPRKNPSDFPGEDYDYLYVTPPVPFSNKKENKIVWAPISAVFLTSGKTIDEERANYVKDRIEKEISFIFSNKESLLDNLAFILKKQMILKRSGKLSLEDEKSFFDPLALLISKARAQENVLNLNSNSEAAQLETMIGSEQMAEINQMLDTNDPNVKQMLLFLLLDFLLRQKNAEALNLEKTACLSSEGQWDGEKCLFDDGQSENCLSGEIDFGELGVGDGKCHESDDLRQNCEEGGGIWNEKDSLTGFQDDTLSGSAFCKSQKTLTFQSSKAILSTTTLEKTLNSKKYTCTCPENYCGDPTGKCITADEAAGDTDKDGAPNGKDKCPKTEGGDSVNLSEESPDFGCSCTDLKKKGKVQAVACPLSECRGDYFVQYPPSATADQLCQDGFIQSPSAFCVPTQTMAQQCVEKNQREKEEEEKKKQQEQQQAQQMMQQAMQALQSLMKGGGGGGSSGGGGSGGGGSGGGSPSSPGSPGSPSSPSSPQAGTPSSSTSVPSESNNPAAIAQEGGYGGPASGEAGSMVPPGGSTGGYGAGPVSTGGPEGVSGGTAAGSGPLPNQPSSWPGTSDGELLAKANQQISEAGDLIGKGEFGKAQDMLSEATKTLDYVSPNTNGLTDARSALDETWSKGFDTQKSGLDLFNQEMALNGKGPGMPGDTSATDFANEMEMLNNNTGLGPDFTPNGSAFGQPDITSPPSDPLIPENPAITGPQTAPDAFGWDQFGPNGEIVDPVNGVQKDMPPSKQQKTDETTEKKEAPHGSEVQN